MKETQPYLLPHLPRTPAAAVHWKQCHNHTLRVLKVGESFNCPGTMPPASSCQTSVHCQSTAAHRIACNVLQAHVLDSALMPYMLHSLSLVFTPLGQKHSTACRRSFKQQHNPSHPPLHNCLDGGHCTVSASCPDMGRTQTLNMRTSELPGQDKDKLMHQQLQHMRQAVTPSGWGSNSAGCPGSASTAAHMLCKPPTKTLMHLPH